MKIYFDSLIFGRQAHGGVSSYWLEFYKRFFVSDECSVFEMKDGEYKNKEFEKFKGYVPLKDRPFPSSLLRLINPPKIKNEQIAIFHSTLYRYIKQKNIINVVTIHDFTHQIYGDFYHRVWNSFMKQKAIEHADGIVCISKNTFNDLLKFYPKAAEKKCTVIYNGANFDVFHKLEKPILPSEYAELNGLKFILFVGNRAGYKNFSFIEKVLQRIPDIHLCLVGGEEYQAKAYFQNRIHHYKHVSDENLNVLYNLSHCFIYPSLYEGFGIPICEAMNAGCPVIAFNNSSIPEVMNGAGILLENNDLNGSIKAIHSLNDKIYRSKIINQQLKACKKFSWDKAYQEMRVFYQSLVDNKRF